jgi:hypothetical protein
MILLSAHISPVLQITGLPSSELVTVLYIASFVILTLVSLLFATRIQASMMLGEIGRNLVKFEYFKNNSRKELLSYLISSCKVPLSEAEREVDRIIEYFTIMPETIDPAGVVGKMEQVVRLQDDRTRQEIKELAPDSDRVQQSIAQNMLGVASTLSQIYKLMRHFYIVGQKMKNPYILAQAQMNMPILLRMAEAYYGALESLKQVQPIGDGIGEMVAGRLMRGCEQKEIARETVYAKSEYKGRTLLVVKSEGPMGTVGMPDVAVQKLTEDPLNKISMLIMIDATLKLEGEKTGEIAQGIGAAIGGIGTEKFRIEEAATRYKIPMYAVVVKESLVDAINVMTKEISESSEKVVTIIQNLIEKKTKESDTIMIVGVGNTVGISQ